MKTKKGGVMNINMYKYPLLLIVVLVLYTTALSQQTTYKEGELLVKFIPNQTAYSVLSESKFSEMRIKIKEHYPNLGVWLISYEDPSRTNREVLERVKGDYRIKSAQFNHRVTPRTTIPNDEYFGNQWCLRNTGQTGGTAGADISATVAWDITTGVSGITSLNDEIIVSVVDGGFDLDHEDLNFTSLVYNVEFDSEDPAYMPVQHHGTAITGIIGAQGNNEDGVSGVGWNTKVFPIGGIFSGDDTAYENKVIASYEYILDLRKQYNQTNGQEGLYIVATNSSFGLGAYGYDPEYHQEWCDSYDSLGVHGILNIAATSNENVDIDQVLDVPTACPSNYLITVTNTDAYDNKYSGPIGGAGWGETTIDLGAPGEDIFTTIIGGYDDLYNNRPISGTSFATPHVTGTIPLIYNILPEDRINYYKSYPAQAPLDIKAAILNSVDPNSSLQGSTPTVSGGRLNVFNALKYIIEHYGADLGRSMNEVVFTDEMTIQNSGTKIALHSNLVLEEDLNLANGASLTFIAKNTVSISCSSGIVTIGGLGVSKIVNDEPKGDKDSEDTAPVKKSLSEVFQLAQNFPNPFNPITVIKYSLPVDEKVIIKIYDVLGKEITVLVNEFKESGEHSVTFDASTLSSGVYFYRINAGKLSQTKKLILAK